MKSRGLLALTLSVAAACGQSESKRGVEEPPPPSPGPAPMRRLTNVEYDNTIYQIFKDDTRPAQGFVPEEEANGFTNQASAVVVSPLLAEQYMTAAEGIAERALPDLLAKLPSCSGGRAQASACRDEIEMLLLDLGMRTFRHPLDAAEVDKWLSLYDEALALDLTYDPGPAIEVMLAAMLQSPNFFYRIEFGDTSKEKSGVVPLTGYEVASRLSYMFWGAMPDVGLFEAAESGELLTREGIEAQARRLLQAPRARQAVRTFYRQWLRLADIGKLRAIGKDSSIYPHFDSSKLPLLQQEAESFVEYATFDGAGSVEALLTAPFTMMNEELAVYYGISGVKGSEFVRVDMDPNRYSGILTQAGLLSVYAKPNRSSAIHRGRWVRMQLFCQPPPAPPDVVPEPPVVDLTKTTREQLKEHSADPACRACHAMMDPIGFGFEHFDGIGMWRDKENGLPIDATGVVEGTDVDGRFDGVVELGKTLASSQLVQECVMLQWFRFVHGRTEADEDATSIDALNRAFEESGYRIQDLLVSITQTDSFRYRPVVVPAE